MTLIPINLPPGMYRNGTDYGARGRWFDGNLVRWHDGAMRPVGGWVRRQDALGVNVVPLTNDPVNETFRDTLPYITNNGSQQTIFASNLGLKLLNAAGDVVDITPLTGFTPGTNGPSQVFGYGIGPYGTGKYGTRRNQASSRTEPAQRWNLDTWGQNVLAAGVNNGPIFEITPDGTPTALSEAPDEVADVITTDQRIVMAIKNGPDEIRQVIWSDREDNKVWTPTTANFAGSQRLQGIGNLIGLYKVLGQVLILSETDAFVARYIGAPFVYGFERVANNCEPLSFSAVAKTDRFAMWLGSRNFWMYDGTVRQVECEVMDYISETIDFDQVSKIWTMTIANFSEIWWFYQSKGSSTDVDSYVMFNYRSNHWATGKLMRTCGNDVGVYESPYMVDAEGLLWNHEQTNVLIDTEPVFALSGPIELNNGQVNTAVRYVFLDTELQNRINIEFFTRQLPTEPDTQHGPYDYLNPVSTTGVLGREVRMQVNGLAAGWEFGTTRWDVQNAGGGFR